MRSYLGRSRLVPERATVSSRSEKSAEAVVADGKPRAKGRTRECEVPPRMSTATRQMSGTPGSQERQAGEARHGSCLDEATLPLRTRNDTGPGLLERFRSGWNHPLTRKSRQTNDLE